MDFQEFGEIIGFPEKSFHLFFFGLFFVFLELDVFGIPRIWTFFLSGVFSFFLSFFLSFCFDFAFHWQSSCRAFSVWEGFSNPETSSCRSGTRFNRNTQSNIDCFSIGAPIKFEHEIVEKENNYAAYHFFFLGGGGG